ncbi:MAG: hypothetical protein CM15mP115_19500 [Alphaproteobacteria bacterium]|nr:MAG: hypothetical protein CM15mP115_19500 [Alphaproteobacteria bacterium]
MKGREISPFGMPVRAPSSGTAGASRPSKRGPKTRVIFELAVVDLGPSLGPTGRPHLSVFFSRSCRQNPGPGHFSRNRGHGKGAALGKKGRHHPHRAGKTKGFKPRPHRPLGQTGVPVVHRLHQQRPGHRSKGFPFFPPPSGGPIRDPFCQPGAPRGAHFPFRETPERVSRESSASGHRKAGPGQIYAAAVGPSHAGDKPRGKLRVAEEKGGRAPGFPLAAPIMRLQIPR